MPLSAKQKQHLNPVHVLHKTCFHTLTTPCCRLCTEHVYCEHQWLFPCDFPQWHGCDTCYWAKCFSWDGQPSNEHVQHHTSQRAQFEPDWVETAAKAFKDQPHKNKCKFRVCIISYPKSVPGGLSVIHQHSILQSILSLSERLRKI